MLESGRELLCELYAKIRTQGLQAKTIVDYTREAFVCEAGNVRVTLDSNIRIRAGQHGFSESGMRYDPSRKPVCGAGGKVGRVFAGCSQIRSTADRQATAAFSKYQVCRMYG